FIFADELSNYGRDVITPLKLQRRGHLFENVGTIKNHVRMHESPNNGFDITVGRRKPALLSKATKDWIGAPTSAGGLNQIYAFSHATFADSSALGCKIDRTGATRS
ncbi:hypothetical protein, partial [Rhizobium sp. Leaf386]|uniref:hypothetical protein n=1 Tax=Rhizobium sp. Leaf386 TaxID=1736359 RepID=UPI00138ECF4C